MADADKVRENRLRRMAARQGMAVIKSRRRDVRALDHGRYYLIDLGTHTVSAGPLEDIDALERALVGDD